MTPEQIAEATRAVVTAGGSSTDRNNRLKGETATEANARITAAYKELTAKPILSKEQIEGGMKVQFVREGAGGFGTYIPVKPLGYKGPTEVTDFTDGIIPKGTQYTTGSRVGLDAGNRTIDEYRKVLVGKLTAGNKLTAEEKAWLDANGKTTTAIKSTTKTTTNKGFETKNGLLYNNGVLFSGKTPDGKQYIEGKIEEESNDDATPTEETVVTPTSTIIPGSGALSGTGTTRTAFDAFKNTLALFFGPTEIGKPWVNELYKTVSGFTKSGSTPEEAFNMALLESETNPAMTDFTKRFKGIFALQKLKQQGKAIEVPTVAEYFKTQETMGDLLKSSNLGSLANEDYLGDVIGKAVSATEFSNRLVSVFDRIDNASDINKKTISRFFPTLDRTQLAKALLTGEKGAKQLQQELAGYEVLAGAEQQGLGVSPTLLSGITNEQAQQIAKGGGTYASTLGQFGQIAGARETEQKLAEISGVQSIGVTGLTSAVISKSASELKKLEDLTRQEEARYMGKAGTSPRALASQSRANRVI